MIAPHTREGATALQCYAPAMLIAAFTALALASPIDDALAAAHGQPVAVVVVKGTWCSVCMAELQRLSVDDLDPAGQIVGVTTEPDSAARAARARLGLTMPLLSDPAAEWVSREGFTHPAGTLPGVQFYDSCGRPAGQIRGRRPTHSQAPVILQRLRELSAQGGCGRISV